MSDLHIEFFPDPECYPTPDKADILILAGDIIQVNEIQMARGFFQHCNDTFKHVIYVLGNHEFYNSDLFETIDTLRILLEDYPNITLLENETKTIEDITFIGANLWYGLNEGSDFSRRTIDPPFIFQQHIDFVKFIEESLADLPEEQKAVVVTHISPSFNSILTKHAEYTNTNGAFAEYLIEDYQPSLWVHGHIHDSIDYSINNTPVRCNPLGYYPDTNPKFCMDAVIEV